MKKTLFLLILLCVVNGKNALSQYPMPMPMPQHQPVAVEPEPIVVDVRITGNNQVPTTKILEKIKTRKDRVFSELQIEEDKRALVQTKLFVDVRATAQKTFNDPIHPNGRIVTFQLIERPLLHYVKFVGNQKYPKSTLLEESGIKSGDALDPISVRQAKERLDSFYKTGGFHNVHIEILAGDRPEDRGAIFLINEGGKQRIYNTEIVGNSNIVSAARLKTQIESKPGILYIFKGEFTRKKLEDDIEILTKYYRDIGFYHAKVAADFVEDEGYTGLGKPHAWVKIRFIVEEGPRCKLNSLKFVGNKLFTDQQFQKEMKSKVGAYYNEPNLLKDLNKMRDMYGNISHVFAKIEPNMILDEDKIDIIFEISEGRPARIESLSVEIVGRDGAEPHTKLITVLDRSTLKPGAAMTAAEMKRTQRLLGASNVFNANPATGFLPTIDFEDSRSDGEQQDEYEQEAQKPTIRGQAPYHDIPTYRGQTGRSMPSLPTYSTQAPGNAGFQPEYAGRMPALPAAATPYVPAVTQTPNDPYAPININTQQQDPTVYPGSNNSYGVEQAAYNNQRTGLFAPPQPFVPGARNPSTNAGGIMDAVMPGSPEHTNIIGVGDNKPKKFVDVPVTIRVQETTTGQFQVSVGVNSDSGLQGRILLEELNFDWKRYPKNIWRAEDWRKAFRGGGQVFRIEASPGQNTSRYEVNWQQPYLFHTKFALGLSGFFYNRYYSEWKETRVGGSVSLGYSLTPDLRINTFFNAQQVEIENRIDSAAPQDLLNVLGYNQQLSIGASISHDTRDNRNLATEGHLYTLTGEHFFGAHSFQKVGMDLRKYIMLHERPDTSGRWVLGFRSAAGYSTDNTPIYERFYAGGFTTIRGFEYRGISPRSTNGIVVGGHFEFYNSVELLFPISADDMIRGVVFLDSGTVESKMNDWVSKYRVAPGVGLRITIPMMGPVPIAFDFAFPISSNPEDKENIFQFYMTMMR